MYVDKKLQGVMAVQALSRLNRSANSLGKKTEDLFVLDFYNSIEDIKKSFDPFYTSTTLSKATDVNVLHELKSSLDESGIYEWFEVEDFVAKYFKGMEADKHLSPIIQIAEERFNNGLELDEKTKANYKIKAKQFVKIYGQMASILPFEVVNWEKLFWFLKFLIPKMIIKDPVQDALDGLLNAVDLNTYGLERIKLNVGILLDPTESEVDPQNPNPRGTHGGDIDENPLDSIIKTFNERYFQGWETTPEEQKVKLISIQSRVIAHPDFQPKVAENKDFHTRDLAFKKIMDDVMSKQRKADMDMYKLYVHDTAFLQAFMDTMKRMTGV